MMVGVIALSLAACETANPTVSQLGDAKSSASQQEFGDVASSDVTCKASEIGCAQLRLVKADSCRRLALQGDTSKLDCAVDNYQLAMEAHRTKPDPRLDETTLQLALLESIHARREASTGAAVGSNNDLLLAEATAATSDPNARAESHYYVANAELNRVLRTQPPPAGCDGVARAEANLSLANAEGTSFADNAQKLDRAIQNAGQTRGC